jgi:acyl-CoA synthetase (AMP-forming)/AMP-acid ligase II
MTAPVITTAPLRNHFLDSQSPGTASIPSLPLFLEAKKHATNNPDKVAVVDRIKGQSFTYCQLLADVSATKKWLLEELTTGDLSERRIAFLLPNGYDYVVVQWAVWAAGGVCVPLCAFLAFSTD